MKLSSGVKKIAVTQGVIRFFLQKQGKKEHFRAKIVGT